MTCRGQKWETLQITQDTSCATLPHCPKAQLYVGKRIGWKPANPKLISTLRDSLTLRIQADHRLTSIPRSALEEYCFTRRCRAKAHTHPVLLQIHSKWIKYLIYKCRLCPKDSELHAAGICHETSQLGQAIYSLNCCKNIHMPKKHLESRREIQEVNCRFPYFTCDLYTSKSFYAFSQHVGQKKVTCVPEPVI